MNRWRLWLGGQADIALVLALIGILLVLFLPIPKPLLDFLILANFGFALLVLLLAFCVARPVDLSTFPSLLLLATLFRLSLNVAATRLILADGDAGRVIAAVGSYVVGGNYVVGLIVFLPFLLIDLIVSALLMALGAMMLPPATVSLPIKILVFVLVDGWNLLLRALVGSFQ